MQLEQDVKPGNIRSIRKILESWPGIIGRYLAFLNNDVPWWYNERATLSTLAAAVWEAGGIALEEYSSEKGRRKNYYIGKCDLYIGTGHQQFVCEAKQVWCNIGPNATTGYSKVRSGLRAACIDARELPEDEGRLLGICFAVPYLHERCEKEGIEQHIENWLRMIQKLKYSSIAWVFPKKARRFKSENGYYYPGVVLLVKEL